MGNTQGHGRRGRRAALAVLVSFGLVAAACGNKKDETSVDAGTDDSEVATETSAAVTEETDGDTPTTDAETPVEETTTTAAAVAPVLGGKLIVAGEAEAANGWLPSVVQCDSFCQERARTFYDSLVTVDKDLNWRPFLAESITANADSTVFTIKLREGIKFHDGTDLNADAGMLNFNNTVKSLLVGASLKDVAKDAEGNAVMEKIDELTYTIATAVPWPLFPYYLGGQAGFVASKKWLDEVTAGTGDATKAVGTGAFTLESFAPGDKLIVKKNPNYWLKDADGNALPYLDEIEFRVIPDPQVAGTALRGGDIDMFSASDSGVVGDFSEDPDFVQVLQDTFSETNYLLLT